MIERFQGPRGRQRLVEALMSQKVLGGAPEPANALADAITLSEVAPGVTIMEEGGADDNVVWIIAGAFDLVVRGRVIARRHAGELVGEMAAIEPMQARSATVVAAEQSVVGMLSRDAFAGLTNRFPSIWRGVAKELAHRLMQRNELLSRVRERPKVFIMSSTETLPIARAIQLGLEHDPFTIEVWTDGVFRASAYPLEDLERILDESDFGVAVAGGDDTVNLRGQRWPAPRDNVTFELGFFMGRLGRCRTLLLEPRGEDIRLPSDLAGMTTIPYTWEPGRHQDARLAPAVTRLRSIFQELGPRA